MLKDIISFPTGEDLKIQQTEAPRAGNVLSVQLGDLEFSPSFGIDLRYFLQSEFQIQTESFQSYCVQRLLESRINVVSVINTVQTLFATFNFGIGTSDNNNGSMIA